MTQLNIDTAEIQRALAVQVLEQITPEARDRLMTQAINSLIEPRQSEDRYGRKETQPSPIQVAFDHAVLNMAREIAQELIADNPEVVRRVKEVVGEQLMIWMDEKYNSMRQAFGEALLSSMRDKLTEVRDY